MKITIKQLIDILSKEDKDTIIDFDINPCGYCIEGFLKELEKEYIELRRTKKKANTTNDCKSYSTL